MAGDNCSRSKNKLQPVDKKNIHQLWIFVNNIQCGYKFYLTNSRNNPLFHLTLEEGRNEILIQLKAQREFAVGLEIWQISSIRNIEFKRCHSRFTYNSKFQTRANLFYSFRFGYAVLELMDLPGGVYGVRPMTNDAGQEGPFVLCIKSTIQIILNEHKRHT